MELYKLRFKTASKTVDDIKSNYDSSPPKDEMLEKMAEAYRNLDGTEVVGAAWGYIPNNYSIYGWNDEDDEKIKEIVYLTEQDEFFGNYIDERERFEADWKNDEYDSSGALHFDKNDFEVIEKMEKK